jgi:hypothetical protein
VWGAAPPLSGPLDVTDVQCQQDQNTHYLGSSLDTQLTATAHFIAEWGEYLGPVSPPEMVHCLKELKMFRLNNAVNKMTFYHCIRVKCKYVALVERY